ncbi:MAG: c-type cytochrome, partial [Pirellulales bacterium]|nr:c-type cytochrome [Pirellulales bacterium]
DGLAGRQNVKPPAGWPELYPKLRESENTELRRVAGKLAQIFGDDDAIASAVATLKNDSAAPETRREALAALVRQKHPELNRLVARLLADDHLRIDAIRAHKFLEDPAAAARLIRSHASFGADAKRAIVETLAARRGFDEVFVRAIESGKIAKADVPTYVARSLEQSLGSSFIKVWGPIKSVSADKAKLLAKYKKLLTDEHVAKGDVAGGRAIYSRTCAACHKLFDAGGEVGPEITGANRANLDYILYQIIDPNDDVPETYRMVLVTTLDGLVLNGRVAEEDADRLVLITTEGRKAILKSEIDERVTSPNSIMPEGLLKDLKDDQVRDLILYLRSTKQVPLPKSATP